MWGRPPRLSAERSEAFLLESRPNRHVLQKACQHWLPAFQRRGDDHSIRFQPAHLSWSEICDDYYFAAYQSFRGVGFCNASQNLPDFRSDINFQPQQLVRLWNPLGNFYQSHTKFDFGEIVDRDLASSID